MNASNFILQTVMYHCGLLLIVLHFSINLVWGSSHSEQLEVNRHLELGKNSLAAGQLADALSHFNVAIEKEPTNYLTYFKRGTVYFALGKAKFAKLDFEKVLELNNEFTGARLQLIKVLMKQEEFDRAEQEIEHLAYLEETSSDAWHMKDSIMLARLERENAERAMDASDYSTAIFHLTKVIEVSPWSAGLRELRAKCYVATADDVSAVTDLRLITKLSSDNTAALLKLTQFLYGLGRVEDSLKEIRDCLKFDPDHKECFTLYRKLKKIAKELKKAEEAEQSQDYEECIVSADNVLLNEPKAAQVRFSAFHLLCKCQTGASKHSQAIENCQEALKIRRDLDVLCDSAEAYLAAEMYDDAIQEYNRALKINPDNQRAKQGLQKAQQRQKQSETRDYYKILGVKRTATKQDIIKAYRKAAQKWHPDNFQEGDQKKLAEKKFIDIAAAKEVLTDKEKREKFDHGEDPLDPESNKHQGFNPFQEFHHFHGSPFQFKFHFN